MAEKQAKARQTMDKWKRKVNYTIFAPEDFDNKALAETVATKPEQLIGRNISAGMRDLTNEVKKQFITVKFKVTEVKGNKAYTTVVGHSIKEIYIKRLIRRRSSKMQVVGDYLTRDAKKVKVKAVVISAKKLAQKKKTGIRNIMKDIIAKYVRGKDQDKIIGELVFGNLPGKIFNEVKKIAAIKRVEITKSNIIKA